MAPPKVDLNNKEKNIDGESIPEAVFVDQKSELNRATVQRRECKRRRKCKAGLICLAVVVVALIVALPILVLHMRRHHRGVFSRWCGTKDYDRVPEHVRIDDQRKLIFVNGTKTGKYDAFNAVHDYDHKISAFRHAQTKRCFMDPLHKSFNDGVREWDREDDDHHGRKGHHDKHSGKPVRYFKALDPTEESVAQSFWGQHVVNHCKDHKFHMLKPLKEAPAKVNTSTTIIIRIVSVDAVRIIYINIKM
ncbi:hypothetical protein LOTGIDRAFT_228913 [Lottia gigantea]|uniref:BRICHOS domain-containing protein n=1 Tax=Lottia gigantea TaxID=225164 RepID=V4BK62_LOTGI|nr:hypothetical protein LOTGIDRAFT_228913 [Lottia gigantea]ESO88949.1 hypothetical protein LOTGIDRAFT_228913 [Lottia gigantea]